MAVTPTVAVAGVLGGSEGLEGVAVVWSCLVRSLDRGSGFLVVDSIITSLAHRFLLAFTVPRGDWGGFNPVSLQLRPFSLSEPRTENREPSTQTRTENCYE